MSINEKWVKKFSISFISCAMLFGCGAETDTNTQGESKEVIVLPVESETNETDESTEDIVLPDAVSEFSLNYESIKQFNFSWIDVADATHYRLLENKDGASGFVQIGDDILPGVQKISLTMPLYLNLNSQYLLQSCIEDHCAESSPVFVNQSIDNSIGYFKASDTDKQDNFGTSVSVSNDGSVMVISAFREDSSDAGYDADQFDDGAPNSGALYVFEREGIIWQQTAFIKASNPDSSDSFGSKVQISGDGNTIVAGAFLEDSDASGIDGDGSNNSSVSSGAAYIFAREGEGWSQTAYLKAAHPGGGDFFGFSVAVNEDGTTVAIGAYGEASDAVGIDGDANNENRGASGAVYIFRNASGAWSQTNYLKASNPSIAALFGYSLALDDSGDNLVVGAKGEKSNALGVNGNQLDASLTKAGAAYLFSFDGINWQQDAYLKANNTGAKDEFGFAVDISGDGTVVAVSSLNEASDAVGVNADGMNDNAEYAGAVYTYHNIEGSWEFDAYLKASNTREYAEFGVALSLNQDGSVVAIGADGDASHASGLFGDQLDTSIEYAGAAYVFQNHSGIWSQSSYIKPSNTISDYTFGASLSLSGDSNTLAVGAYGENGSATGVNGDQTEQTVSDSGAAYLY